MKELNFLEVCELFSKAFYSDYGKEPKVICVKTGMFTIGIRNEIKKHILESKSFVDTLDDFLCELGVDNIVTFGEIHSDSRGHLLFESDIIDDIHQILYNQYYLMD